MVEIFRMIVGLQPPFNMVVLVVLICSGAGVLSTIATQIRKFGCHRQETDFKRELVDRGLNADEIERIIAAKGPRTGDGPTTVHVGNYVASKS